MKETKVCRMERGKKKDQEINKIKENLKYNEE